MATFTQYVPPIPARLGMQPTIIEFANTEDFLSNPFMQNIATVAKFSHFALNGIYLVMVGDDGFLWMVIGTIDHPEVLQLPRWEGWKFRALLDDGTRTVLTGRDVAVCDAPRLTLMDGRSATIISE